jgi:hypothetical protein
VAQNGFEELRRDIRIEQTVAVLLERRLVPHGIIDSEANEPPEQKVVVNLPHQLALGAHRLERLQERGAQQPLGYDRLPAGALVETLELGVEADQNVVEYHLDDPEWRPGRHLAFKVDVRDDLRPFSPPVRG